MVGAVAHTCSVDWWVQQDARRHVLLLTPHPRTCSTSRRHSFLSLHDEECLYVHHNYVEWEVQVLGGVQGAKVGVFATI